ncbi:MAG: PQQ-binding-like beta-propeller repeat protein, partial [Mycolicibacterium sp.]
VALISAIVLLAGVVFGGGFLLIDRLTGSAEDEGGFVAGQLRGTFPDPPTLGWRLDGGTVFEGAEFVRPDATSYQYLRPGFVDLGDTLIASAILPQSDRGATLVAVDAESGDIRWTADAGFKPVCATAVIDGLLPCVGRDATFGAAVSAPRKVSFLRMSDGTIDHTIPVADHVQFVEVRDSAVYTMGFHLEQKATIISRGSVDDLTADWERQYQSSRDGGCVGSGDTLFDGVDGNLVYTGNDAGLLVVSTADGNLMAPQDSVNLAVFDGQGFTVQTCDTTDPDIRTTSVIDTQGQVLRTVADSPYYAVEPWLLRPDSIVPYIIGDTAYEFATGDELWTAAGDVEPRSIIGDTVLGNDERGLAGLDLGTGELLWSSGLQTNRIELSDGRRVMVATENGLVALDLATGEELWTAAGIDAPYLAPAGDGFAEAEGEFIAYYPPTGGPSVAPGRGDVNPPSEVDGTGGPITKCGRTPQMRPVEYRAEGGALFVKMEVKARCPGGDIVSTDRLRVTVRDQLGRICSGVFDFSKDPLVLGADGAETTTLELEFGPGTFSRHPNTLGERAGRPTESGEIVTESTASGNELVDCEDEGTSGGPHSADTVTREAEFKTRPDQSVGPVSACGSDEDALAALRAQIDADRPFVQSQLANRWVAQLSSKQPGLVAPDVDGRVVTWTPCEILQQHLRMRGQYPEVRLVWSDEWTFDLAGWWVTVAGVTFPDPDAANGWCDARAIPVDECYAKVISNSSDSRGTTKYRR